MKTTKITEQTLTTKAIGTLALAGCVFLSGCATYDTAMGSGTSVTASDQTRMTQSGFLSDYARLKPTAWGDGIQCWRSDKFDAKAYDKIMVSRILVSLVPPKDGKADATIDPSDLKTLTDYFHNSLLTSLKPQMQVVEQTGAGVVVMRIALTDLVPTTVTQSVAGTLIPYAFIAEAGSGVATGRPAGSTPYMGQAGMEMQFRDGVTGVIISECRDTEIGRKYAADAKSGTTGAVQTWASGYVNSFQSWAYARNAFDKWSLLVAQRIGQLRSTQTTNFR